MKITWGTAKKSHFVTLLSCAVMCCVLNTIAISSPQSNPKVEVFSNYLKLMNATPDIDTAKLQSTFNKNANTSVDSLEPYQQVATDLKIRLERKKLTFNELKNQGIPALLYLRNPDELVILQAIDQQYAIVEFESGAAIVDNTTLEQRYNGEELVFYSSNPLKTSVSVDNPIFVANAHSVVNIVTAKMSIHNQGSQLLNLGIEGTSCGCTQAELSSRTLRPGQSATLTMTMNANGGWGSKLVTAIVGTSDPQWPNVVLGLYVNRPKTVVPSPTQLSIDAQEGKTTSRLISLLLPAQASVTDISTNHSFITAKRLNLDSIDGGNVQHIEVIVDKSAPSGKLTGNVVIKIANAPLDRVEVPIDGFVEPDISASPNQIFLGQVAKGTTLHKIVTIQSYNGRAFAIQKFDSNSSLITTHVNSHAMAVAQKVEVDIKVDGEPNSLFQGNITFTLSTGRTISIPVVGLVTL